MGYFIPGLFSEHGFNQASLHFLRGKKDRERVIFIPEPCIMHRWRMAACVNIYPREEEDQVFCFLTVHSKLNHLVISSSFYSIHIHHIT